MNASFYYQNGWFNICLCEQKTYSKERAKCKCIVKAETYSSSLLKDSSIFSFLLFLEETKHSSAVIIEIIKAKVYEINRFILSFWLVDCRAIRNVCRVVNYCQKMFQRFYVSNKWEIQREVRYVKQSCCALNRKFEQVCCDWRKEFVQMKYYCANKKRKYRWTKY